MKYFNNKIIRSFIFISALFFTSQVTGQAQPKAPPPAPPVIINDQPFTVNPKGGIQAAATLYSIGDPTAEEQLVLEFINRARADANAEAQRLVTSTDEDVLSAIDFFGVDLGVMVNQFATLTQTLPPLSMNAQLTTAARLHSQDMFNNVFQGHFSSDDPVSPNEPDDSIGDRAIKQGYNFMNLGENVFSSARSVFESHAAFEIDWGFTPTGIQDPPGHRNSIHGSVFREAGIGIVLGTNSSGGNSVGPLVVTHDLGVQLIGATPFITGVAYDDQNGNAFYDLGEGLGGINVDVDGSEFFAVTATTGGYSVPVPGNGNYSVTFSDSSITDQTTQIVISNSGNKKLDYTPQAAGSNGGNEPDPNALIIGGTGDIAGENIQHANGNVFDQILLTGESVQLQAKAGQITRVSFMDENEDIVQVEFSGNGTFTVTLDPATFLPPAIPPRYNQAVEYVTGKPSVIIDGADANTFFSIFTVGRINAFNQALFPEGQVYDAEADVTLVEVINSTGMGGMQLSNTVFSGNTGKVGLDARGVPIAVRLTVGDINASGNAIPHLLFGVGSFTVPAGNPGLRITGGDLLQSNNASIVIAESGSRTPGFETLIFQNNFKSDNTPQPTQNNAATFVNEDGVEITKPVDEITIE
jgi:hypothetical protein